MKNNLTESPIEDLVFNSLKEFGLIPKTQYEVFPFFLDFAFPEIKLGIEADGKKWHSGKENEERDRYRDEKLKSLGWIIERFSGSVIMRSPDIVTSKIALKYFKDKLTKEQKDKAMSILVRYFTQFKKTRDIDLALRLVNEYVKDENYDKKTN